MKIWYKKWNEAIDLILWAIVWLAPFFSYGIIYYRAGLEVASVFEWIDSKFAFNYVKNILDTIWNGAFSCPLVLSGYISYLTAVEIAHCLFDAIIFIPRFAHDLIGRFTDFATGRK